METLVFTIACKTGKKKQKVIRVSPPIDIIDLKPDCVANNDFLTLPPYYKDGSTYKVKSEIQKFKKKFKNQTFTLWEPFKEAIPRLNLSWEEKDLEGIEKN